MSPNDFGGYRGRTTASEVLRVIIIILSVLVVAAIAFLIYAQRYLVYSDDGVRLELPPFLSFLQTEEPGPAGPDPGDATIVERLPEPEPEPEPEPPPEPPLAALQLSLEALRDGTAGPLLEQAGANALVVEMKSPQGTLNWFSGEDLAELADINFADRGINQVLRDWNAGEVYTVARVSCLRDNTVPYHRRALAVRATYGNWQDDRRTRWLNPADPAVQSYIAALCGELAALGFDEILLESCTFPTRGNLRSTTGLQQGEARVQTIQGPDGLLEQIRAAVEPYEAKLSILLDGPLSENDAGGLTQEGLERLLDRAWLPRQEDAGQESEGTVFIVPELTADLQAGQAVLLPDSPVVSPARK